MIEKSVIIAALLITPFFYIGVINKVKAFWAGRKGPSILQPFYDFIKLLRKGEVISWTSSLILVIGPSVSFASILLAGLFVPLIQRLTVFSFDASFILFACLLGLGKFFSILSALDTGSSFEGMGASREAVFNSLVEPAFFIVIGTLAFLDGGISFSGIFTIPVNSNPFYLLIVVLGAIALFIMLLTEGCRIPVDDPGTHLELTMIHEVMVLDNSGPDLAFIFYGSCLKMVIITSLIAALIVPAGWSFILSGFAWIGIEILAAALVGTVESITARLRMNHVVQFIFAMTSVALIILSAAALWMNGGLK